MKFKLGVNIIWVVCLKFVKKIDDVIIISFLSFVTPKKSNFPSVNQIKPKFGLGVDLGSDFKF